MTVEVLVLIWEGVAISANDDINLVNFQVALWHTSWHLSVNNHYPNIVLKQISISTSKSDIGWALGNKYKGSKEYNWDDDEADKGLLITLPFSFSLYIYITASPNVHSVLV
jgi:hypothetical protein